MSEKHIHNHEHGACNGHCHHHKSDNKKLQFILYVVSVILFIFTITVIPNNIKIITYLIVILLSGFDLIVEGIKNIFKLNFEEDTLMTIAVIAAFILREFPESCMVVLLYKMGEFLEDRTVSKSQKGIEEIAKIKSDTANILNKDGDSDVVLAEKVQIGDKIIIKPGEKVPLDCVIISGTSNIDTSAITGESKPISVEKNDRLLSGSINLTGALVAIVEKDLANSTATQIIDLVYEASNNKGEVEKFITKFSKIYTPMVIILAILISIIPPLFGILDFRTWIERSLIFLVASCPCSIVISIPLAMFAGVGAMSKKGLLVKGTKHIENFAKAKIIAFDKTGTLTTGKMELDKIEIIGEYDNNTVLQYIVNLEKLSNHPMSSMFDKLKRDIPNIEVKEYMELPGYGLYGKIDENEVVFGNNRLMEKYGIELLNDIQKGTYLGINKKLVAYVTVKEELNRNNVNIVEQLQKVGIKRVVMLTGDNANAAKVVGDKLGIKEVYYELLPQNKQEEINKLKSNNQKVIFVGDGINDSPVLTSSDFGISMGKGTQIANNISDSILLSNQIANIPGCKKIANKTMRVVEENITFSLLIKALVLILGVFGSTPIWLAILADTGITMLTVANAIRIYKK